MSKIKNGGLDQHGAEPFEQQQFETASVERVKLPQLYSIVLYHLAGYEDPYVQCMRCHKVRQSIIHLTRICKKSLFRRQFSHEFYKAKKRNRNLYTSSIW